MGMNITIMPSIMRARPIARRFVTCFLLGFSIFEKALVANSGYQVAIKRRYRAASSKYRPNAISPAAAVTKTQNVNGSA